jgi:hypothetical protein
MDSWLHYFGWMSVAWDYFGNGRRKPAASKKRWKIWRSWKKLRGNSRIWDTGEYCWELSAIIDRSHSSCRSQLVGACDFESKRKKQRQPKIEWHCSESFFNFAQSDSEPEKAWLGLIQFVLRLPRWFLCLCANWSNSTALSHSYRPGRSHSDPDEGRNRRWLCELDFLKYYSYHILVLIKTHSMESRISYSWSHVVSSLTDLGSHLRPASFSPEFFS